jgi:glycerophosphoryl diester phosphodiesterase
MELVLHRANTLDRIERALAAGMHRLEVDVWYKGGRFRISHDPSIGRTVVGPNGVALLDGHSGRARRAWRLHRVHSFLSLPELLEAYPALPPLLVDLKGVWPSEGLRRLASLLEGRPDDQVCGALVWSVDRYRAIHPAASTTYSDRQLTARRLGITSNGSAGSVTLGVTVRATSLPRLRVDGTLERWAAAGVRVFVWEIPDLTALRSLNEQGFAGAILDDPSWASQTDP